MTAPVSGAVFLNPIFMSPAVLHSLSFACVALFVVNMCTHLTKENRTLMTQVGWIFTGCFHNVKASIKSLLMYAKEMGNDTGN